MGLEHVARRVCWALVLLALLVCCSSFARCGVYWALLVCIGAGASSDNCCSYGLDWTGTGWELVWAGRAALGEEAVGKDFFFLFLVLASFFSSFSSFDVMVVEKL
jgi:hypothetical protein